MLYREIIAVCSEIHTKHINTLCGQNVELLNVKLAAYTVSKRQKIGHTIYYVCTVRRVFFRCLPTLHTVAT